MSQPPKRTYSGKSTPQSIRVNDQLWEDFTRTSLTFGYKPQEAMKWLMERFVEENRDSIGADPPIHDVKAEPKLPPDE